MAVMTVNILLPSVVAFEHIEKIILNSFAGFLIDFQKKSLAIKRTNFYFHLK